MKIIYKRMFIGTILISVINLIAYGNVDLFGKSSFRKTRSFADESISADVYYDMALRGEFCKKECKEDAFLLSSLKLLKEKSIGRERGGIYESNDGEIWMVKKVDPVKEYLGSKVMNLLMGPWSPEVMLFADSNLVASKFLSDFVMKNDIMNLSSHKPIIGEEELEAAMNVMGLGDRHGENVGYIETSEYLESARVDFDASFQFFKLENSKKPSEIYGPGCKRIYEIPDEMILYVLGDAFTDLWNAGISLDYEMYKDLGSSLIARKHGLTDLIQKVKEKDLDAVRLLLEDERIDINARDVSHDTMLLLAMQQDDNLPMIRLLLEKNPDLNAKGGSKVTALTLAMFNRQIELIHLLIEAGADPNMPDDYGDTPLNEAVRIRSIDIVRLLLEKGADINAKDKYGKTALDIAIRRNADVAMIDLLREWERKESSL